MSNELAQFESAARQIESLLAELRPDEPAQPAIGPEWMARAQSVVSSADALLAKCGPTMPKLKTAPEVCRYRKQLAAMGQALQQLQPKLQAQSTALRDEHMRVKRLQGWSNSVGKVM